VRRTARERNAEEMLVAWKRLAILAALVLVVAIVAFAARDGIAQTTEAIATPTSSFVGNDISPDSLVPYNDAFLYHNTGRAAPQALP
jgi:hypothetical protein